MIGLSDDSTDSMGSMDSANVYIEVKDTKDIEVGLNGDFLSENSLQEHNENKLVPEWTCYICLDTKHNIPRIQCNVCIDGKVCSDCSIDFLNNNTICGVCRTELNTVISNQHTIQFVLQPIINNERQLSPLVKIIFSFIVVFMNIAINIFVFTRYYTKCENESYKIINNISINNGFFMLSSIIYYFLLNYLFRKTFFYYIKMRLYHLFLSNLYIFFYYNIFIHVKCSAITIKNISFTYLETESLNLTFNVIVKMIYH